MDTFVKVEYSRSKIEKAGKEISKTIGISEENAEYLKIVDNWRAAHAFPLQKISDLVESVVPEQNGFLSVHRLKRLDSIIGKLQRPNNSGLYRMQDLGGCRVIVPTVKDVYSIVDKIRTVLVDEGHIIKREDDYLTTPRENSGYRSYHLVVQYKGNDDYNDMSVEIQVRTTLQHTWATAVEIIDFIERDNLAFGAGIERNGLKAGAGKDVYRYFFKLVSALFSINEETGIVAGVPQSKQEIIESIYNIDKVENIRSKLASYSHAIQITGERPEEADFYLLITDVKRGTLSINSFDQSQLALATDVYLSMEKEVDHAFVDVVLVAAKSFNALKESYSNYFGGAQLFLYYVGEYCSDIPEKPDIIVNTRSNCRKLLELFDVAAYGPNIPNDKYFDEGIGVSTGSLYFCFDMRMTLEDSYLRFSGIKVDEKKIKKIIPEIETIHIKGPGILASRRGACYYIDDEEWDLISGCDCLVIQPKDCSSKEDLKVLISWLKSNLFIWDIVWNKNARSLLQKGILEKICIPIVDKEQRKTLVDTTEAIIDAEYEFVKLGEKNADDVISDEQVYQFNYNIIELLQKNEAVFNAFFSVSDEEQKNIEHELDLQGYFVYEQ